MASIDILVHKCIGCKQCLKECPFGAIKMEKKKAVILDNCTLCGSCVSACRFQAINFVKGEVIAKDLSAFKGIWIFAQQKNGKVSEVVFELLGEAIKLAEKLKTDVSAVILGESLKDATKKLITYGADKVYKIENKELKDFNDEIYADILRQLINEYKPEIVLFGATTYGRSLAPRIASKLNTGLTADCTILEIDEEKKLLLQTRPAFGGNLMATIICPNHRPQMATVRPKVMKAIEPNFNRTGHIISPKVNLRTALKVKVLDIVDIMKSEIAIEEADIIVAAGRGIGNIKNIRLIEEFAREIGGAVAASRAVIDAGWLEYPHQVGQTGKTVAPKIYFALGISGAIQHLAGMSSSDVIVAVNNDPEAPIFKIARYGIVGDLTEVLPELIRTFREKMKKTVV
ncbi:MAG TPA: electron transfer flavoprotein subunit alpha [Clostridia bacterium]|nr:electron transfer flavoprotein subunit alpha [Clostridia bacterium]